MSDAETLGASRPTGNIVPRTLRIRAADRAVSLRSGAGEEAAGRGGLSERVRRRRPVSAAALFRARRGDRQLSRAVGIRIRMRPMERAALLRALQSKKAKGVCLCTTALYGNAATRLSEVVPSNGAWAYGGYPDIDELFKQQVDRNRPKKREAMLHQIQRLVHERVRFGPICEYIWPSGIGPRVEEPALMLINPYPWSAPLEEVRLEEELRRAAAAARLPAAQSRRRPNDTGEPHALPSAVPGPRLARARGERTSRISAPSATSPARRRTRPSTRSWSAST